VSRFSGGPTLQQTYCLPSAFLRDPALRAREFSLPEAQAYTRWLARTHYENFHVVTFLLPRRLHQDFFNIYAYCRWADDLADELDHPEQSLRWLEWWREQLDQMYQGRAHHPVFVALRDTVARHDLPKEPFADLLRAFVQDQTVHRYATYDDLLHYCRYSANPVGRLVLHLCGYRDESRMQLADATCTALQLTNFWQDVVPDWQRGRLYIPLEAMARHGVSEEDIARRRCTAAFQRLMREAVTLAREFFNQGLPLIQMVDRRLAVDIALFSQGGLRVLEKIEAQQYNVLARRPVLTRRDRLALLAKTVLKTLGRGVS